MWSKCLAALISLALIGIALIVNARRRTEVNLLTSDAEIVEAKIDSQASPVDPIRTVRFTLFEAGIRPAEMRIKAGLVNLLIEDRTNTATEVVLQKEIATENVVVGRIAKDLTKSRGRNTFRLGPGEYRLYDSGRPTNTAVLQVEP